MNRALDLALSVPALFAGAPLLLAGAALVRLTDGAPVLFSQERVGANRKPFRIWKLRTMRDGQVIGAGRLLRATGIDELPQLANVLRGEMSLVGPRPLTRADIDRLGWSAPRYDCRWSVRPGLTGPAQLHAGARCGARITWVLDRAYVAAPSVTRDLALLAATALCAIFGKDGARRVAARVRRW